MAAPSVCGAGDAGPCYCRDSRDSQATAAEDEPAIKRSQQPSRWPSRGYLGASGRLKPDGTGNLSGSDTFSLDGTASKRQYTGTYSVNADCSGSMTWNTPGPLGSTHFDFVIVNNSKTVNIIQTDSAFILTGKADLQTQ